MRFITRMDYGRTCGWWVRISAQGKNLASKLFSDLKHGGKDSALAEAKAWRDQQEARYATRLGLTPNKRRHHQSDRRNLSGVVGVVPDVSRRNGVGIRACKAIWTDAAGASRYKRYSVVQHGYSGAFRQALKKRCEMVGIEVPSIQPSPEARLIDVLAAR